MVFTRQPSIPIITKARMNPMGGKSFALKVMTESSIGINFKYSFPALLSSIHINSHVKVISIIKMPL